MAILVLSFKTGCDCASPQRNLFLRIDFLLTSSFTVSPCVQTNFIK